MIDPGFHYYRSDSVNDHYGVGACSGCGGYEVFAAVPEGYVLAIALVSVCTWSEFQMNWNPNNQIR
jgi:hypothetical protein